MVVVEIALSVYIQPEQSNPVVFKWSNVDSAAPSPKSEQIIRFKQGKPRLYSFKLGVADVAVESDWRESSAVAFKSTDVNEPRLLSLIHI